MFEDLLKARFGTFTDNEFSVLCGDFANGSDLAASSKKNHARRALMVFFGHNVPTSQQLKTIYSYGDNLKWLYLSNMSSKRKLTEEEQQFMVSFMHFGPVFRFPHQLSEDAVALMFAVGDVSRIATYVRDFPLPEQFELELIDRYAQGKPYDAASFTKCDYRVALGRYLEQCQCPKCLSAKVQDKLLEVADEEMWCKLCSCHNMSENVLQKNTIRELIAKRYSLAVKALLLHSFIPTVELQRHLLSSFPDLKWELEISKVRHALRGLEIKAHSFMGVETPSYNEMKIIDCAVLNDDKSEYAERVALPLLEANTATPYFCAWAVYECPKLGEKAYACLRAFAEKYRDKKC